MACRKQRMTPTAPEITAMTRDAIARVGIRAAAEELGVSRHVLLTAAAGLELSAGALALLREAQQRLGNAA